MEKIWGRHCNLQAAERAISRSIGIRLDDLSLWVVFPSWTQHRTVWDKRDGWSDLCYGEMKCEGNVWHCAKPREEIRRDDIVPVYAVVRAAGAEHLMQSVRSVDMRRPQERRQEVAGGCYN
ncbi:hypothetical protein QC761_0067670 [Podospora bellae-mahoneyi]|uniref:Uncharacterized protein n=1 Tax=Podospora bellae-mahoneyi TaxID=2093777 RepID=A0ABR0FKL3_9PEZI|nr:hypothetical protein QC761_0067670 [Podospora bellae-mahoneyi]